MAAHVLGLSTAIHRAQAKRGATTRQLGLNYRDSSLTEETRPPPVPCAPATASPT